MLITVSGPAGVGKSTFATGLADALGYEHVSGGDVFRGLADERGMTLVELNRAAEEDDQVDRDLDRRLRTIASERDDLVIESRLAGWMAGDHADFRVWLTAPFEVRLRRIAEREGTSVEEARRETEARSESERRRYMEYYDIDINDLSIYDVALNTARLDPEGVVATVRTMIERYDPATDEGKAPVEGVRYEF